MQQFLIGFVWFHSYYNAWHEQDHLFIQTELCDGTLEQHKRLSAVWSEETLCDILRQVKLPNKENPKKWNRNSLSFQGCNWSWCVTQSWFSSFGCETSKWMVMRFLPDVDWLFQENIYVSVDESACDMDASATLHDVMNQVNNSNNMHSETNDGFKWGKTLSTLQH